MICRLAAGLTPVRRAARWFQSAFENGVIGRQKLVDQLVNPELVSWVKTERGSAYNFPLDDDVNAVAQVVSENAQDPSTTDPLMGLLPLPQCPTLRTAVFCSAELLADSAIDLPEWLADRFGIRFGRL